MQLLQLFIIVFDNILAQNIINGGYNFWVSTRGYYNGNSFAYDIHPMISSLKFDQSQFSYTNPDVIVGNYYWCQNGYIYWIPICSHLTIFYSITNNIIIIDKQTTHITWNFNCDNPYDPQDLCHFYGDGTCSCGGAFVDTCYQRGIVNDNVALVNYNLLGSFQETQYSQMRKFPLLGINETRWPNLNDGLFVKSNKNVPNLNDSFKIPFFITITLLGFLLLFLILTCVKLKIVLKENRIIVQS